jgi:hypothetical protein
VGSGEDYQMDGGDVIEHLNAAGAEGWGLVGVAKSPARGTLVTKYEMKRHAEHS